jgi:hypothetical protein
VLLSKDRGWKEVELNFKTLQAIASTFSLASVDTNVYQSFAPFTIESAKKEVSKMMRSTKGQNGSRGTKSELRPAK